MSYLVFFPKEIHHFLCTFLSQREVINIGLTCKALYKIYLETPEIWHKLIINTNNKDFSKIKQLPYISNLQIRGSSFNLDEFDKISRVAKKLETLTLVKTNEITNAFISIFKNLKCIIVTGRSVVDIGMIVRFSPKLDTLVIVGIIFDNPQKFLRLNELKKLTHLELVCVGYTNLSDLDLPKLECLRFQKEDNPTAGISLGKFPKLKKIFTNCPGICSDIQLSTVPKIKGIILPNLSVIHPEIFGLTPMLKKIIIPRCVDITDASLALMNKVEFLDLNTKVEISSNALAKMGKLRCLFLKNYWNDINLLSPIPKINLLSKKITLSELMTSKTLKEVKLFVFDNKAGYQFCFDYNMFNGNESLKIISTPRY